MIVASNLCKRYPGGYEAIRDISFQIETGEMVFITGHSGAGRARGGRRVRHRLSRDQVFRRRPQGGCQPALDIGAVKA